ncbi:MAG: FABP family protein [Acidimicrobiales bacterium]|jgi:hypothetical protein
MPSDSPPVHELLQPIGFLLGEWKGDGQGLWAGGFSFGDSMRFSHDGRPVMTYAQQTVGPDGVPSHAELGFFVAQDNGEIHVTLAEPSGITEVLVGKPNGTSLVLSAVEIGHTPTTDNVTACGRHLRIEAEALVVEIQVAVDDEPLAPHTRSVLHRLA